jgi:hypothetical protein
MTEYGWGSLPALIVCPLPGRYISAVQHLRSLFIPVHHRHQLFVCEPFLSSAGCLLPHSARPLLAANAVCAMLSLQALLNPEPANGRAVCLRQPASVVVSNSTPDATTASRGAMDAHLTVRRRASRSTTPLPKSKTQGPVRFPPFEVVDEAANQHIARYQISSFGQIQQCCEHIPYNSTKKDFYEKTGRESIEGMVTRTTLWATS